LKLRLFIFLLFNFISLANSKPFTISKNDEAFQIENPKGWEGFYNFMGFPLLFNGAYDQAKGRPSLSVTMTGIEDPGFDSNDLSQSQKNYFDGRKKWLDSRNGTFKKEIPYTQFFTKNKNKVFEIGFEYILDNKSFIEKTFFYFCPSSMVHIKLLMNEAHRSFLPEISKVIQNAKCSKIPSRKSK